MKQYKMIWKISTKIQTIIALTFLILLNIIAWPNIKTTYILVDTIVFIISIYSVYRISKSKIILTNEYIIFPTDFKNEKLLWGDIQSIEFFKNYYLLYKDVTVVRNTKNRKYILINNTYENYEDLLYEIIKNIKDVNKNIEIPKILLNK